MKKNQTDDPSDKTKFVYGMEWVDRAGLCGKYTGPVDDDDVPNGKGTMKYEFGLVAEGEWIKGVLNEGGLGGVTNPAAMSVTGGMSVPPGMNMSGGATSVVSRLGMRSVGGSGGRMVNGMSATYPNPAVVMGKGGTGVLNNLKAFEKR